MFPGPFRDLPSAALGAVKSSQEQTDATLFFTLFCEQLPWWPQTLLFAEGKHQGEGCAGAKGQG